MAIPSEVITLAGKARLATATTENWNSVITAGLFKSLAGALNAPALDKDFVGLVEVLTSVYIVQTLETFSDIDYTIWRRNSYNDGGTRAWTDWQNITSTGGFGSPGGAITIPYTFSTLTSDADHGDGLLSLNNATQSSATTIRTDLLASNSTDWTAVLDSLADSTSTLKGEIRLFLTSDPAKWLLFSFSSLASPSGYRNLSVSCLDASEANPFSDLDDVTFCFDRTGDKGDIGITGAVGGAISIPFLFTTDTSNTDPGSGFIGFNEATQNLTTIIHTDFLNSNGINIDSLILSFADSTNSIKGFLRLFKTSDPLSYLLFSISATVAHTGFNNIHGTCIGYSSASPFAASDELTICFDRAGDLGATGATGAAGIDGATGPAGQGFTNLGAWSSLTAYVPYDVVENAGSSYTCIANNTNQVPPNITYWTLLSSKGDTGATGATGSTGATGPTGATGASWTPGDYGTQECFPIAISDTITALTTGTVPITFHFPYAFSLTKIKAGVNTVSSSGVPTFDVKKNGTSVFSTKVTIDAGENHSSTAATAAVLTSTPLSIASADAITFSIDVAGTGTKQAVIYLIGYATGAG